MERRDIFRILTATAVAGARAEAQHAHETTKPTVKKRAAPRFFSPVEAVTLDHLCDLLLPSDADGPGAREADVVSYLDTVLHHAEPRLRQVWTRGLAAVNDTAQREFHKSFAECEPAQQISLMNQMAANESDPQTDVQRFFGVLKRGAVDAFAQSAAGRQFLGYRGDTAISSFPGCTHPEHQS